MILNIENIKNIKEIKFCEHIVITNIKYDIFVFDVVYFKDYGIGLELDGGKFIKNIAIVDSKLIIYYGDGTTEKMESEVTGISINDDSFQKRANHLQIAGNLFLYNEEMASKYALPLTEAYDKGPKKRTLVKENN